MQFSLKPKAIHFPHRVLFQRLVDIIPVKHLVIPENSGAVYYIMMLYDKTLDMRVSFTKVNNFLLPEEIGKNT